MAVYWLLFAFAAIMALAYPVGQPVGGRGVGQPLAFAAFVLVYTLIGTLRYEIGGDWPTYMTMLDDMSQGSLADALAYTDPLFGLLAWVSLQVGGGIYMINGVACLILVWGVIAVSAKLPEPWLATLIAVPYTLIVVGMGYVRQGAAIGLLLLAIAHFDRAKPGRAIIYMVLAAGFHSTAVFAFPAFAWSMARRNKGYAVVGAIAASVAFTFFLAPRLTNFESGYLENEYDSSGAAARLAMSLLPSLLILAKYKTFALGDRARGIWISIALAN
ncbi:MAG: EpsG family protein, partial [Novosphingobium sp.]